MRTIYIDSEFQCHATDDGAMTVVETYFFDGKCDAFIEGYRYVPEGSTWTREDGEVFTGTMVAPCKDYTILAAYQEQYEAMMAEAESAYQEGVESA